MTSYTGDQRRRRPHTFKECYTHNTGNVSYKPLTEDDTVNDL